MLTYRDFLADEYRRQEQMARAENHRLLQCALGKRNGERRLLHRTLAWVGKMLILVGERMQTPSIRPEPPILSRWG